ncbi:hypothetical protein SELMODRAFT_418621 [Selaginella moellendorffii]|uniref:Uncharacterized protein n=1 Tax=Selaginella moellendorffii TaxID=88036 RepID=D8S6L9_SELML|nr:hypothetical protein SELMODRAFT_418621 [Selaginella moellendorffii]
MGHPGRTLEIPVQSGKDTSSCAPCESEIQITRIGGNGTRPPQKPCCSSCSSAGYEIPPPTPAPYNRALPNDVEFPLPEPVPRLDLMSARPTPNKNTVYEIPPTPPGAATPSSNASRDKSVRVREISVISAKPPHDLDRIREEHPSVHIEVEEPSDITIGVRNISVNGGKDEKGKETNRDGYEEKEAPAEQMGSPPLMASENSLIDFSLFLLKNARSREKVRRSLAKDLNEKKGAAEPEEDLEGLLRKWEAAQLEEAAAARAKEEELLRASPAVPMFPGIKELPLLNYINAEGKIEPQCDPNTAVSAFAVLDRLKKVQYIGIAKSLRNSMRKIMGRKPGFCYYYKVYHLPNVESFPKPNYVKQRWIEELGSPPPGNADETQRKQWEQPAEVSVGAVMDRGSVLAAAIEKAKGLIQIMVRRGLKEEMIYDPALMELGRCDVLETTTPADAPKGKHTVVTTPYGGTVDYFICYHDKSKLSNGWLYDVTINKDNQETR